MNTEAIQKAIDTYLEAEKRVYPQYTHRASSVGHPCPRFLYYAIHDWDKAAPVSNQLQGIFKTGTVLEDKLIAYFNEGIGPNSDPPMRIIGTQTPVRDKLMEQYNISGTCDGLLQAQVDGVWTNLGKIDIKTCSANLFRSYHDLESLQRHTWSSQYAAQTMVYAFADNLERGYLAFVSKQNIFHDWKLIEVPVDYEAMEVLLAKCDHVNQCLKANTPPNRLNRPIWCTDCRFEAVCLPEVEYDGSGPLINEDENIQRLVSRITALKPLVKEHDLLDKELKKSLIPGQDLILEKAMLGWKQINGTRQPQPGGPFSYWRMKITPTDDVDDDDE